MSSVGRAASRGSKSGKGDHTAPTKTQKPDTKTETTKSMDNPKAQPTPEQMRIAQIIEARNDDPSMKEKIRQVMDATHKTEIEVCTALHDCDNDLDRAVNMLIEGQGMGEWELSVKKKKSRQPSANSKADVAPTRAVGSGGDVDGENWDDETPVKPPVATDSQQRTRSRGSGGPPRMRGRGSQDNRGWRGRENKENERNLEDSRGGSATTSGGAGSAGGGPGDREQRDSFRRGPGGGGRGGRLSNGPSRGGGRGGSRTGPRAFQGRGGQDRGSAPFPRSIETWNPEEDGADRKTNNFPSPEDWDNEEYTGSLADTKVFTPSSVTADSTGPDTIASLTVNNSSSEASHSSQAINSNSLDYAQASVGSETLTAAQTQYLRQFQDNKLSSSSAISGLSTLSSADQKAPARGLTPSTAPTSNATPSNTYNSYAASAAVSTSYPTSYSAVSAAIPSSSPPDSGYAASAAVNSSYSSYQSGQSQPASYTATATSYSTVYGSQTPSYTNQETVTQASATPAQPLPARTKTQRPRVPPPSKIPQSAVEMPGDSVNSILLDVQFGALDFGSDAFDTSATEPQQSPQSQPVQSSQQTLPVSQTQSQQSAMSKYTASSTAGPGMESVASSTTQPGMDLDPFTTAGQKAAVLTQTLKQLSSADSLLQSQQQSQTPTQQSQSSPQSQAPSSDLKSQQSNYSQPSRGPTSVGVGVPSALDSLVKNDVSATSNTSGSVSVSNTNATGSLAYSAPSSNYQSSYQSQKSNVAAGYQSSYSSAPTPSYPSSSTSYPSMSQGYPGGVSSQAYQNVSGVQSVYSSGGSNAGGNSNSVLGSNSGYTTSSSAAPYQNSYGTSTAPAANTNKLSSALANASKDAQYDSTATSTSNLSSSMASTNSAGAPGLTNASVNNSPALGLPGAATLSNTNNTTSTKVTNSTAKSGVVPNMPPGVPPMITGTHQYIMSQGGLPYFQQPVYGYEDQQLLPLRIPHMTAGYYDIGFQQAPTSLATGREGSLTNVPYSMSDGRFARTDSASPVPSSLSQQNASQAHQQPMMNAAGFPPGYAYYYSGSMVPGNYQYGTPAIYPQVAPATNAHGNSNTTQYPKPGSYGSGYGSGYDSLSASQEYGKAGGYAGGHGGAQSASKAGVGANAPSTGSSASDLYNKTHVALSKVNSYEKQGFHSGTPPPFNLAGNQSTGMAPSGAYPPPLFIPPMPHQQHHSTTLMQHPMHQQMDMRNPARRSDSGSSSGQRSQSSAQPSKPGAKQNYASPSYWTPN